MGVANRCNRHTRVRALGAWSGVVFALSGCSASSNVGDGGASSVGKIVVAVDDETASRAVQVVDFGRIRRGETGRLQIELINRTSRSLRIDRFETSCECLTLIGLPLTLAAFEKCTLELRLDQSHEKEFVGNLGINLGCYSGNRCVFEIRADASIVSGESSRLTVPFGQGKHVS
jgi:hypothetical protein